MTPLRTPRDDADSARMAAGLLEAIRLRQNAIQRDIEAIYAMAARPGPMQAVFRDARKALTVLVDSDGLERAGDGFRYAVAHLHDLQAEREAVPAQGRLAAEVRA